MTKNQKGLTLIELLIYIVMVPIVLVALMQFYSSLTRNAKKNRLLTGMYQNARTSIYFIENELRMAGYSPNRFEDWAVFTPAVNSGITSSTSTNTNSISFTYIADGDDFDNDYDGSIDEPNEMANISFLLNGNDLVRVTTDSAGTARTQIITSGIQSLIFGYTNNPDNSVNVRIQILATTLKGIPNRKNPTTRSFTSNVKCRNIGL